MQDAVFQCDNALQQLLKANAVEKVIAARLRQSSSFCAFLHELRAHVGRIVSASDVHGSAGRPSGPQRPSHYNELVQELDRIGWEYLVNIDPKLTSLEFEAADAAGRRHRFTVTLPPQYPDVPPAVTTSLPSALNLQWSAQTGCLALVLEQFTQALAKYAPFCLVCARRTRALRYARGSRGGTRRRVTHFNGRRCTEPTRKGGRRANAHCPSLSRALSLSLSLSFSLSLSLSLALALYARTCTHAATTHSLSWMALLPGH